MPPAGKPVNFFNFILSLSPKHAIPDVLIICFYLWLCLWRLHFFHCQKNEAKNARPAKLLRQTVPGQANPPVLAGSRFLDGRINKNNSFPLILTDILHYSAVTFSRYSEEPDWLPTDNSLTRNPQPTNSPLANS